MLFFQISSRLPSHFFGRHLKHRSAEVRRFISEDLKTKIALGFDELRASARKIGEQDPAFLEFDIEIGRCSTEVQRALDDAATWFTHADIEASRRYFTLTQIVRIAIDSALKCQRAFEPEISSSVDGDFEMSASSLVFVHDVVFVALDNVRAHSGLKKPKVDMHVQPNPDDGALTIEVISDAKPQNRIAKEKTLSDIGI